MIRSAIISPSLRLAPVGRLQRICGDVRYHSVKPFKPQSQLYVHCMDGRYFISFSKKSALTPLGQISNRSSLDEASSKDVSNSEFTENKQFMKLLQETVAEHIHNDFAYIIEAGAAPSSYVPIYDFRSPPSYGRATDADGALGYVRADESGKIMPGSYESNYSYRPLSDPYGFLKLSDHIYEKLLERLEK